MDNIYDDMSREELEERLKELEEERQVDVYTKSEAIRALAVITDMGLEEKEFDDGSTLRISDKISYNGMLADGFRHVLKWIVDNTDKEIPSKDEIEDVRAHHYYD